MRASRVCSAFTAAAAGLAAGVAVAAARPRKARSNLPPPTPPPLPPGRALTLPGRGETFIREAAGPSPDAPTVLLLHGWLVSADVNFFQVYEPLSAVARVVTLDHRGHGRGLRPAHPFRLTDAADDAAAVLDELGAGPVIVFGYSMGSAIGELLWQRRPDLVRGLVLSAASASYAERARDRWAWRGMGMFQLGLRLLPRSTWERGLQAQASGAIPPILSRLVHPGTPEHLVDLLPWIVGEADRGSREDLAEAGRELGRYDATGWIGDIDVPVVVLVTCDDRLVPADRQRELAARIPTARRVELACDHDGPLSHPDLFVPALVDAVRAVDAAGRLRSGTAGTSSGRRHA